MSDFGRSGADAPSGHSAKPEPVCAVSAADAASTPNAGDWILYSQWDGSYATARADKVSAKIIKVSGSSRWDRQIRREAVVAVLPTKDAAQTLLQSIHGAVGEYHRRRAAAQFECNNRQHDAKVALQKAVARLIAKVRGQ